MYKVVKEMGKAENVYLQNTDTMAEINLGRITAGIMHALRKDGYEFETVDEKEGRITFKEKWNFAPKFDGKAILAGIKQLRV